MHWLLFLIILIGIIGAVAFLNLNKGISKMVDDEASEYEIAEVD